MSELTDRGVRPNAVPWPPLLLVAGIVGAFVVHGFVPWSFDVSLTGRLVSAVVAFVIGMAALGLVLWSSRTLRRAKTTIMPNKAAEHLVTDGPFAWSRNPIYVADGLAFLALWAVTRSFWFLIAGAVVLALIHVLAVKREEAHLAARFGDAWTEYAARVPRWIGFSKG